MNYTAQLQASLQIDESTRATNADLSHDSDTSFSEQASTQSENESQPTHPAISSDHGVMRLKMVIFGSAQFLQQLVTDAACTRCKHLLTSVGKEVSIVHSKKIRKLQRSPVIRSKVQSAKISRSKAENLPSEASQLLANYLRAE